MGAAIRTAAAHDARAIAVLQVASWQTAYRGLLPDGLLDGLSVDDREQTWRHLLAEGVRVLVSEQEPGGARALTGFASCGPSRDDDAPAGCGELYALYAHPDVWGRGVGRDLHSAALTELASSGQVEASLWVLDGNARAIRFYEAHGWRPDGGVRVEQLPGADLRELRCRRPVAPGDGTGQP